MRLIGMAAALELYNSVALFLMTSPFRIQDISLLSLQYASTIGSLAEMLSSSLLMKTTGTQVQGVVDLLLL